MRIHILIIVKPSFVRKNVLFNISSQFEVHALLAVCMGEVFWLYCILFYILMNTIDKIDQHTRRNFNPTRLINFTSNKLLKKYSVDQLPTYLPYLKCETSLKNLDHTRRKIPSRSKISYNTTYNGHNLRLLLTKLAVKYL